jgi:choline kinase
MKVKLNNDRIVEVNKTMDVNLADCESIGILRFKKESAQPLIKILDALVRREENLNIWFLVAIQQLIDSGFQVTPIPTNGRPWIEIDTPEDYQKAIEMKCDFGLFESISTAA